MSDCENFVADLKKLLESYNCSIVVCNCKVNFCDTENVLTIAVKSEYAGNNHVSNVGLNSKQQKIIERELEEVFNSEQQEKIERELEEVFNSEQQEKIERELEELLSSEQQDILKRQLENGLNEPQTKKHRSS